MITEIGPQSPRSLTRLLAICEIAGVPLCTFPIDHSVGSGKQAVAGENGRGVHHDGRVRLWLPWSAWVSKRSKYLRLIVVVPRHGPT
jgi:hypothetical protein